MPTQSDIDFLAIDVETANADMASICQIGVAGYKNGNLKFEWKSYIDPEDEFDWINIGIHGITEETVAGAPRFFEAANPLRTVLEGNIVVCHTHFDRVALNRAFQKNNINPPNCHWLDSARVARRTWPECARKGYGLSALCQMLGYEFQHHDALEDAKASAYILMQACEKNGLSINEWLVRVRNPIISNSENPSSPSIKRKGNPDGYYAGDTLAFTGALDISRHEAANIASALGFQVTQSVTKNTTFLVVGDQDIRKFSGKMKSSKQIAAEKLIASGTQIKIIKESDFMALFTSLQS